MKPNTIVSLLGLIPALIAAPAVAMPPPCTAAGGGAPVQSPVFVRNLSGQTGWYASPVVFDLDGDGDNELVAAYYDVYVFDAGGVLLDRTTNQQGRVYAPHVVADLDGDGIIEIVAGHTSRWSVSVP